MDLSTDEDHFQGRLLHQAALWDNLELLQELIASGEAVDARDHCNRSALHAAALAERSRCLAALCAAGAEIDAKSDAATGGKDDDLGAVVCSRGALVQLSPASVLVVQRPPLKPLMYRNMLPELPATACQHCQNLFYMEDFEIQLVTKGHCPFCRHPAEEPRNGDEETESSLLNDSSPTTTSPSNDRSSW